MSSPPAGMTIPRLVLPGPEAGAAVLPVAAAGVDDATIDGEAATG